MEFIIDIGSRSLKLYQIISNASVEKLMLVDVTSWNPLHCSHDGFEIQCKLEYLLRHVEPGAGVIAVGTAAMRRSQLLADLTESACIRLGVKFEVVDQATEAELIRLAVSCEHGCFDIINAGGGSIQVVKDNNSFTLIPFGISDLNRLFELNDHPRKRLAQKCIDYVKERLPPDCGPFIYTGGERSYLLKLGANVREDGLVEKKEFFRIAGWVNTLSLRDLEKNSPFDPSWMHGAIASNLIVQAYLEKSGTDSFIASDLNIANGLLLQVRKRKLL